METTVVGTKVEYNSEQNNTQFYLNFNLKITDVKYLTNID